MKHELAAMLNTTRISKAPDGMPEITEQLNRADHGDEGEQKPFDE
jgi:hypothetical protein